MDFGLEGKNCLIIGGSKGLGLASAVSLAREGAHVALVSRSAANLERAREEILKEVRGASVFIHSADMTKPDFAENALSEIQKDFGGIDVFVGGSGGPNAGAALTMPYQDILDALQANFLSLMHLTQQVAKNMQSKRWGRIVFIGSSGLIQPINNLATSNSARAALLGFSKTLSNELAGDGITVNMVSPGNVLTERLETLIAGKASRNEVSAEEQAKADQAKIPAGRFGNPDEFGNTVAFICSKQASYITGSHIRVDGGLVCSI